MMVWRGQIKRDDRLERLTNVRTPKIAVEDKGLLSYKSLILILTLILTYYLSQYPHFV